MRISRIRLENYRNFHQFQVSLDDHAVIVGENKVGKSNLLRALRLVLDPSLADSARQLRIEDFWDGLPRPLTCDQRILIAVDLTDFETDENLLAVLAEHLVVPRPMTSRLTYVFQPLSTLSGEPTKDSDYEFLVYGGDRPENAIGYEVRSRIPLDVLQALRDAEGDLANWHRSPLKPLLDKAVGTIPQDELDALAECVREATTQVKEHPAVRELGQRVVQRFTEMVGSSHAVDTELGFSPTDPQRLFRALRLFIEGGSRGIADASLGTANLIYLALKSLELEQLVEQGRRDHSFLAIEEPEAHLHPHLQRLVYRDFLRPRAQEGADGDEQRASTTVLLTTHSPHVVSIAPLRSLVLLRRQKDSDSISTSGVSTAQAPFTPEDVQDLERYLDVTRGEILFARGVLLVEGDAEQFLLPILGRLSGTDFDRLGITVCSVSGTNFTPYIKLLGRRGLRIPHAVITDYDPLPSGEALGPGRINRLLKEVLPEEQYRNVTSTNLLEVGEKRGFFLNTHTFEVDLFQAGNSPVMCHALGELTENGAARRRAAAWQSRLENLDVEQFLKDINAVGKGRYAQRVAATMTEAVVPPYIQEAIAYVASRCG